MWRWRSTYAARGEPASTAAYACALSGEIVFFCFVATQSFEPVALGVAHRVAGTSWLLDGPGFFLLLARDDGLPGDPSAHLYFVSPLSLSFW